MVLCVPGHRVPVCGTLQGQAAAGRQQWCALCLWCGRYRGTWMVVTPSETQALLVAGAVPQGGGTEMDWGEASCSVQIFQPGNLLLEKSFTFTS